jgi:hypothetical protein
MQSPMISIYKPNSNSASFGRFLEGGELRVCYDTDTEFPAGLARVKAETLSRSGRISRVRPGYGSGNRVKAFSLSRGDQAIRVRLGYARVRQKPYLGLVSALSLNPDLVSSVSWVGLGLYPLTWIGLTSHFQNIL